MQQTTKRLPASSPCNPPPTMLHIPFLKQRYICVSFLLKDIPDGSPLIQFLFLTGKPLTIASLPMHSSFSFCFTQCTFYTHTHTHTHKGLSRSYLLLKYTEPRGKIKGTCELGLKKIAS